MYPVLQWIALGASLALLLVLIDVWRHSAPLEQAFGGVLIVVGMLCIALAAVSD